MSAQFVCQGRQDRHVAIGRPFSMDDVNRRWVAMNKQIFDADVDEFSHPRTALEQRLDHQAVFALAAISGLNQALHFAWLQPGDRSVARVWRLEPQTTPDLLHHVFGLIVPEMMLAPEAEGLVDDRVEGLRDRFVTTQSAPWGAFQDGHEDLEAVELCAVSLFCAVLISIL